MLSFHKATGPGDIPVKFIKLSANVIDSHLANIINKDIDLNCYSENAKIADARPIFKKDERTEVKTYPLVSLLNIFSKIYERFFTFLLFLSEIISAYPKTYSTNHVLIENWKKSLDQNKFAAANFMDLSMALNCIPHDLLIAKMHAYEFSSEGLTFFYS